MSHDEGILTGLDRVTDEPRFISEVVSGKACNCCCPECGSDLVAKKGPKMAHHFAHAVLPPDIRRCQESALHLSAKFIAAHVIRHLYIPERNIQVVSTSQEIGITGRFQRRHLMHTLGARNVERLSGAVEPLVPEISPFRPDARVNTAFGTFFIEIKVTHAVPPEKQQAMKDQNLAVLEVDLSTTPRRGISQEAIRDLVTFNAPRHWLSFGCDTEVARLQREVDESVCQREASEHEALMERLRADLEAPLPEFLRIHHYRAKPGGDRSIMLKNMPVTNVRQQNGFTMADLPVAKNVLVTTISDDTSINRLFAWHGSLKRHPLTVLSISDSTGIYTASPSVLKRLFEYRGNLDTRVSRNRHEGIIHRLRTNWGGPLPETIWVEAFKAWPDGPHVPYSANVSLSRIRQIKGFTFADVHEFQDVMVVFDDEQLSINYLFARHAKVKGGPLTVLALTKSATIITNARSVLNKLRQYSSR